MAQQWIERIKRGKGAVYSFRGELITDQAQLDYFKSLGIPPAWREVKIARSKASKVLATGLDAAGRTQYRYHPKFRARQDEAKFERILRFARALPDMRQTVDKDLKRPKLDYQKVMATIVSIMDQTYIRVGNDTYARDNISYGLTTLRSKHTDVQGSTITFEFVGKSGKHHVKRVSDKALARIVRQLDNLPGYEVFKYYDEQGSLHDVKSSDVNIYIKAIMGDEFSAKDFRTWAGTLIASADLAAAEQAESEQERKKLVTACVQKVSKKLGNTPAIARGSYIDPRIIQRFMDGEDLSAVAGTVQNMKQQKGAQYLSPEEQSVLCLLEG